MKQLKGEILEVKDLTFWEKERMFELMRIHFDYVEKKIFYNDLHEKEWTIVLKDCDSGEIEGFSTLMLLDNCIQGIKIKALFSGDTIIHKDYWWETELARVFIKFIFSLIYKYREKKLYWFLTSMGHRTYRILPLLFKEFYPKWNKPTPKFEKKVLDTLAYQKYPSIYDSKTGIIHLSTYHLKSDLAEIPTNKLKNPHIKFFVEKNPFCSSGDELACISELNERNLTPAFYRLL